MMNAINSDHSSVCDSLASVVQIRFDDFYRKNSIFVVQWHANEIANILKDVELQNGIENGHLIGPNESYKNTENCVVWHPECGLFYLILC